MGWFRRRSDDADEVQALRAEVAAMSSRLAEADRRRQQARTRPEPPPPVPAPPPPAPLTVAPAQGHDIDSLVGRVDALASRLDQIDGRLTAIATELAAQIDEVGREGVPVDELRQAQVRLAAEQARYQIEFNQSLAELADEVRRDGLGD